MASIPLPALSINTSQPNPIEQYARLQQIKNAQQQQQFQQQLQPLQIQKAQQETESGAIDLQLNQIKLKNNQVAQGALADPNFSRDLKDWQNSRQQNPSTQPQTSTTTPQPTSGAVQLHPVAQFLAEKKGLSMFGPGGALEI